MYYIFISHDLNAYHFIITHFLFLRLHKKNRLSICYYIAYKSRSVIRYAFYI